MQSMNDMDQFDEGTGGLLDTDDDAQQLPLGLDDPAFGADAIGGTRGGGASKSKTPLILVAVLLVAAGTLYGMRMTGGIEKSDTTTAEAEKKIEDALRQLTGGTKTTASDPLVKRNLDELFRDTEDVIALFGDDPTKNQVELENVKKNPFELIVMRKETKDSTAQAVAAIDKVKAKRLEELKKELATFKLQSIMSGKVALAVIDGKVVREGESVGSFQITSISPYGVRLAAEGNLYTLSMKKPETN